jgi:peptidyl-prolyl cis-trans isomerase SurA
MKSILALLPLLLVASEAAAQETRIAAIVNDEIVSQSDLTNRLLLVMRSSNMQDNPQNRTRISTQVLRTLIDEKLQLQEAKRLNISVSQEEIDQAFGRIEQQNHMTKGGLDTFLTQAGIARSSLIDQITASLAWAKLVRNRVMQDVTISEEEVSEALKQLKDNADVLQSHVAEIFVAIDNPSQEDEAQQLANRLVEQIRGGVNFSVVAQQFSQSPSAAVGGDVGWVTPNQLPPVLGDAIEKMKPGQMSYPLHTTSGYYILYLVDQRKIGQPNPGDTVLSLVQVAFPMAPNADAAEQQRITAELQQISDAVKSCGELAKVGRDRAPQTSREIPEMRAADLPPVVRQAALALGIAEASKPLALPPAGMGVIMVCQRKDPPGGMPSRDDVTEQLGRARLDALARRYLRDLRRGAWVDIRG